MTSDISRCYFTFGMNVFDSRKLQREKTEKVLNITADKRIQHHLLQHMRTPHINIPPPLASCMHVYLLIDQPEGVQSSKKSAVCNN